MLVSNKIIINLSYKDQLFWLIYVTIDYLDIKTYYSQNWLDILLLDLISIVYKQIKDLNNKNRDLKVKIYYLALKTIFEYIYTIFIIYI